ncbi:MAG: UDP-N-acetylglucosamine--N-acetylmuramyl-(pentapeptide) pyrophosphoryl-undecaprenol N-acetylglucosamine transferase [Veillonella sp.]|nr:UDP-N-acetylglucosamine--N-acetylmuramyl-(pentapeptide) pyrophosphoryl-undecaprenol N-acetylglucosamine transferase [Veillonella sp.]
MKRVIISGGGTGGHIYPAITIYKEIMKQNPDAKVLYVGTKQGLEATLVPKEGIEFTTIPVQGLQRQLSLGTLVTLGKTALGIVKANAIVCKFKPDVVIGTGGYVCGPILLAAALHNIPTIIQEQNVIAGITNKILSRFVDVVALGYKDAEASFSKAKRVVYTGNPVRPDVLVDSRTVGRNGDGLGCSSLILPYLHDMPKALAAADLAVFRSGAIGLAELAVRGIPSVLIPYPYAAEDHQTYNARIFVQEGAAHMIVDKMLSAHDLIGEIEMFMANRDLLAQMGDRALQLGKPNAAHDIAKLALSIAK